MLAVAVLAAGQGTRMKSALPKVLHTIAGSTLIERVLQSCRGLHPEEWLVVVGHQSELVQESLSNWQGLNFVRQSPQLGTGHAVQQLQEVLNEFQGDLLVLNGDVPLLQPETIKQLLETHRSKNANATLLAARLTDPEGYGRVIANDQGRVKAIIEDRDCSKAEKENNLTNSGVYCFKWNQLNKIITKLSNNNNQKEIYLTDAIELLSETFYLEVKDPNEVKGINNKMQLAECEELAQKRLRNHWMTEGVKFILPSSCTLTDKCVFGKDVIVEPQSHFRGKCEIGDSCKIGPNSLIENSKLEKNVTFSYSIANESYICSDVKVGPFSHLRPGTHISTKCKIGNFVEIKKSKVDRETNINHLSYIGDSVIGKNVNIGAGTITANYDGVKKNKTIIGDQTKTGANSVLIAPIKIGSRVTIAAGSAINKDVNDESLAIARPKQIVKNKLHESD